MQGRWSAQAWHSQNVTIQTLLLGACRVLLSYLKKRPPRGFSVHYGCLLHTLSHKWVGTSSLPHVGQCSPLGIRGRKLPVRKLLRCLIFSGKISSSRSLSPLLVAVCLSVLDFIFKLRARTERKLPSEARCMQCTGAADCCWNYCRPFSKKGLTVSDLNYWMLVCYRSRQF